MAVAGLRIQKRAEVNVEGPVAAAEVVDHMSQRVAVPDFGEKTREK